MNPPIVQIAIPIAVAVDRTGVGNNSAATKNTAENMIINLKICYKRLAILDKPVRLRKDFTRIKRTDSEFTDKCKPADKL